MSKKFIKIAIFATFAGISIGLVLGEYGAQLRHKFELETIQNKFSQEKEQLALQVREELKEKLKRGILEDLAQCETGFVKDPDGAIILDTNNEMSIGRYMFQRETIRYYYKKFYQKDISRAEAIKIAVDKEKATELAEKILFEEEMGWKNWFNCARKLNLPKRIKDVQNL